MFRSPAIAIGIPSSVPANAVRTALFTTFFTITLAARSRFGSSEPTRPARHYKTLRMDSG
jgi:hypothetical protein